LDVEAANQGASQDWLRLSEWVMLAAGTDGEDGPTDAAGAFLDSSRFENAEETLSSLGRQLSRNDAYPVFHAHDALLISGPTNTNVGDLQIVICHGSAT
jgi:glycerate-2-kinase